ncbi:hypothetical protein Ahy_A07g033068 [Arachis hypogaea]|uniref:ATP-dependent DNA helicase n=1 Tax=Arachis hypogaea TaxID=3818 RepID=A0A445C851_ARAHY|nr:hypothetical protein Ahy_A07g033068 [Arachis hypogaea]
MTDEELQTFCQIEIEKLLQANRRSLRDFAGMQLPNVNLVSQFSNSIVLRELEYDISVMLEGHDSNFPKLNEEQKSIYDRIIHCVTNKEHGLFFIYGFGGTGNFFFIDSYLPNCVLKEELLLMFLQVELLHYCYLVVRQLILCLVSQLN